MTAATYDGNGLRASATTTPSGGSSTTQNFVWDTVAPTARLLMDSGNAYIYGLSATPAEQVKLSTGAITYLVPDTLGSVRGIVSSAGTLTASASYDAWGNPQTSGGLNSYTPFGFAGAYTDPTGLMYLINRYYDPGTGQFISLDPDVRQTQQPYAYANGNPVSNTDPSGDSAAGYAFWGPFCFYGYCLGGGSLLGYIQGFGLWVSDAGGNFAALSGDVCQWNLTVAWFNHSNPPRRYRDQTDSVHESCNPPGGEEYFTNHYVVRGGMCTRLWIDYYGKRVAEECHRIFPQ